MGYHSARSLPPGGHVLAGLAGADVHDARRGRYEPVPMREDGAFVVNIGDALEVLSNGRCSGTKRYTGLRFFLDPSDLRQPRSVGLVSAFVYKGLAGHRVLCLKGLGQFLQSFRGFLHLFTVVS